MWVRNDFGSDEDLCCGLRNPFGGGDSSLLAGALPGLDPIAPFGGSTRVFSESTMASSMGVDPPLLLGFFGLFVIVLSEVVIQMSLLDDDEVVIDGDRSGAPLPLGDRPGFVWFGEILWSTRRFLYSQWVGWC